MVHDGGQLEKRLLPVTIGVTGHIDISLDELERAERDVEDLLDSLARRFPASPLKLITSLAVGSDRLAARVFLRKKSEFERRSPDLGKKWEMIVPLPLPKDIYEADFPDSIDEFRSLLANAAFWFALPVRPEYGISDISDLGEARDLQYEDASRFVASHSDILIALWDGLDPQRKGGTCETVRMKLQGHGVTSRLHYSPLSRSESRTVHHIRVSRVQETGAHSVAVNLAEHSFYSTSVDGTLSLISDLRELDAYNSAASRYVDNTRFSKSIEYCMSDTVRETVLSSGSDYSARACLESFATADALAIYYEARWRSLTKIIYGLGFCTALLLPVAIEGMFMPWAMVGYFVFLAVAFAIVLFMRRARIENRHIESRALAELLRVQFAWLHSGIEDPSNPVNRQVSGCAMMPLPVTQILLGQQQVDLGWINQAISHLVLAQQRDLMPTRAAATDGFAVVRDWVNGQAKYFKKSSMHAEKRAILFGRVSIAFVVGGLSSALGAILSVIDPELEFLRHILVVLSAALPVAGFVLENASERFGIEAQARMRHRLHEVYQRCEELLARPGLDHATRERLIIETGREAVAEAVMWLFLRRIKPVKVSI